MTRVARISCLKISYFSTSRWWLHLLSNLYFTVNTLAPNLEKLLYNISHHVGTSHSPPGVLWHVREGKGPILDVASQLASPREVALHLCSLTHSGVIIKVLGGMQIQHYLTSMNNLTLTPRCSPWLGSGDHEGPRRLSNKNTRPSGLWLSVEGAVHLFFFIKDEWDVWLQVSFNERSSYWGKAIIPGAQLSWSSLKKVGSVKESGEHRSLFLVVANQTNCLSHHTSCS